MVFDLHKLADPEFFCENRLPAHSDHVWYKDWEEAADRYGNLFHSGTAVLPDAGTSILPDVLGRKSSFRMFLDGPFYFHYAKNPAQIIDGFQKKDYDCKNWDIITVPAHIQMEGYEENLKKII